MVPDAPLMSKGFRTNVQEGNWMQATDGYARREAPPSSTGPDASGQHFTGASPPQVHVVGVRGVAAMFERPETDVKAAPHLSGNKASSLEERFVQDKQLVSSPAVSLDASAQVFSVHHFFSDSPQQV